jgi:hypothetical protein
MDRIHIIRRVEGYGNLVKFFAAAIIGLVIGVVLGATIINSNSMDTELSQENTASLAELTVISEPSVAQDVVTMMTADPYYTASTATTMDIQVYDTQSRILYIYNGAEVMTDPYQTTVALMTADPYYTASTALTTDIQAYDAQGRILYHYRGAEVMTDPYLTTVALMTADPYYSATP